MLTGGIDLGIKTVKAVIVRDNEIVASNIAPSGGFERSKSAEQVWEKSLQQAQVAASDLERIIATGTGKVDVGFTTNNVVEIVADVQGGLWLVPESRTIIDVGAEQIRVVKYDGNGKIDTYTLNQQCGAGLGFFAEAMARTLEVTLDEMNELALKAKTEIPINAECGNYASLDILSLIHSNTAREDIAWAVLDAIANKIAATVNLTDIDRDNIVLIGGVAKNKGIVHALKRRMEVDFVIPENPEMVGALGSAVIGANEAQA